MAKVSVSGKNRILSSLSPADTALLQPHLEPVDLTLRQVLERPNKPITHSYFINYGLASIIAANSHKRLEVGLIGCEGFTGLPIVLGNDRSPNETFIQVAGDGLRISAVKLRKAIQKSRSLERALLGFAHNFLNQTANTALSNGTATLEERLARWLLMANDRLRGDEIPLTHEFLSLMLGVRRKAYWRDTKACAAAVWIGQIQIGIAGAFTAALWLLGEIAVATVSFKFEDVANG